MVPMLLLGGLIAGWAAETASRRGGYGLVPDLVVGLLGSVLAGVSNWLLFAPDLGMVATVFVGFAGAALTITAQRGLWRSGRLVTT